MNINAPLFLTMVSAAYLVFCLLAALHEAMKKKIGAMMLSLAGALLALLVYLHNVKLITL